MDKKIIFMDVDGTLVNDSDIIPESAKMAIKEARNNGHYVFLCTGRSKAELFSEIMDIGFDGIIAAGGGYIEIAGNVVMHKKFASEDVSRLISYFDQNKIDFYLEANGGLFASKHCKEHLLRIFSIIEGFDPSTSSFLNSLLEEDDLCREDINKVSFLTSDVPFTNIKKEFDAHFNVIPSTVPIFGEHSGEISILGVHKATAIQTVLEYLTLSHEDTFAYGDGINDAEMITFVKHGIAMGNAKEELKKLASDITDTHNEHGIYNSFKKYKLIK